ncbi:MAG: lipid-A-disaccharide synthase [Gammaproteobacteria bacterium]|nr:lipid-A-disaccharide synthase [Gammaproteobacteria bacterium]UCG18989.1 MAG: lipid-A-disaccharide synthase [Thiotrichales bacterium]HQR81583.1 lipid-A-disaccharide synthase [Thiotrichales bacterium]HQR96087.1 lipid-A-disaccharide synthase [Thiotrichales bacterium]
MASFADSPKLVVLLAAEPSADALGASIAQAWQTHDPSVRLVGMAGPLMRVAGVEDWWQMEQVSVMGLWEVLKQYPRLKRLQTEVMNRLLSEKPDCVLGIDGPDFNLAIESVLRQAAIPSYHLVAPTVWAWRPGRAARMAEKTDGLLCLFPFEPPYFLVHDLPAVAIGHPLADQLPLIPDKLSARQALGIEADAKVLAVLPGSRRSEWQYNAPLFWQTISQLQQQDAELVVLVPCLHERMQQTLMASANGLSVRFVIAQQGARQVLTAADVALVASGTATLETALCHTPMVVAYRMHWLSHAIISRLLRTRWIALPNIIANRGVVPELLQSDATPEALVAALSPLFNDASAREVQLSWFEQMHQQLKHNAAQTAVAQLIQWWQARRG